MKNFFSFISVCDLDKWVKVTYLQTFMMVITCTNMELLASVVIELL